MEDALQLTPFQGAEDRYSGYLLPPGARLFITHDEVLIVDPREMKMKHSPFYSCFPHQTGVTERSIGDYERSAADSVVDQVMVSQLANRIRNCFSLVFDHHYQIRVVYKSGVTYFDVGWVGERIEHPLKMVLSSEPGCGQSWDEKQYKNGLAPPARTRPKPNGQNQYCGRCN